MMSFQILGNFSDMTSMLQQLMFVGTMKYVKSAFQTRLTGEHLKVNLLARCSFFKAIIDDSVKAKLKSL